MCDCILCIVHALKNSFMNVVNVVKKIRYERLNLQLLIGLSNRLGESELLCVCVCVCVCGVWCVVCVCVCVVCVCGVCACARVRLEAFC